MLAAMIGGHQRWRVWALHAQHHVRSTDVFDYGAFDALEQRGRNYDLNQDTTPDANIAEQQCSLLNK